MDTAIKPRIVTITCTGVDPTVMKIAAGQDVTWINKDTVAHSINPFSSYSIMPGSSFVHAFPTAGEFVYTVDTSAGRISVG